MAKKILYIITKSDIGGAQKYVRDLSNNLDREKFNPKIIYGGKDLKWLSNKACPEFLFFNDWLAIFELIKIYKKERPDIIHLNSSKTGVLGSIAAKIYKTVNNKSLTAMPKVIFTAHGWVFNHTNAISTPVKWFYITLHKFAALFQDKIICVSEYDYNLSMQYKIIPKEKLITIHNGIDQNMEFLDKETARKELIKSAGFLNPNWPWIGSIGRLVKEKNYQTFIEAAALIPNAYFFLIGSGPEEKNLKVISYKLKINNRFFFIDPTGNDAQYLKAFDIFIMSSIKEGLPYILLESMAAELPIIVTEAGGMPEIIKNRENGLMVAQKNPDLLAKAIKGILTNKSVASELSKAAKETLKEKFNLAKMIEETSEVY